MEYFAICTSPGITENPSVSGHEDDVQEKPGDA